MACSLLNGPDKTRIQPSFPLVTRLSIPENAKVARTDSACSLVLNEPHWTKKRASVVAGFGVVIAGAGSCFTGAEGCEGCTEGAVVVGGVMTTCERGTSPL